MVKDATQSDDGTREKDREDRMSGLIDADALAEALGIAEGGDSE